MAGERSDNHWLVCIDTGGTFTDCLARDPAGRLHRAKVLSSGALRGRVIDVLDDRTLRIEQQWAACDDFVRGFEVHRLGDERSVGRVARFDSQESVVECDAACGGLERDAMIELRSDEESPVLAARLVTRTPAGAELPPMRMRLATTRATNALLERRGASTALFITRGFGDLLEIGDQQRPDLFALTIRKRPQHYELSIEVDERLDAKGEVLQPLDENALAFDAQEVIKRGYRVAAIAFLHSYSNPIHEQRAAAILRRAGFEHVSCSHEMAEAIRIVPRAQSAVVNAYLAPVMEEYLANVGAGIKCKSVNGAGTAPLHVMTSAGALVSAAKIHAKDMVLSGPAGGVVGAAAAGRRSGFAKIISFDMGGTSTDVARFDGEFEYLFEHTVGGARLMAPALAIETVAAGGGSTCEFAAGMLQVGPRSAGAFPGPACYGAGGPLTLTDVNLLLGRIDPEQFEIPLNRSAAEAALQRVRGAVVSAGRSMSNDELLQGFIAIADQRMATAIEQISLRRGFDPAEHALVAFGGAGGQHACGVAGRLGIRTIIMPADASLLSAVGLDHAVIERFARRQLLQKLSECEPVLKRDFASLQRQAMEEVKLEGVDRLSIAVHRRVLNLRLLGQDSTLEVEWHDGLDVQEAFAGAYRSVYGHNPRLDRKPIEVESLVVVASAAKSNEQTAAGDAREYAAEPVRHVPALLGGAWIDAPVYSRAGLKSGARFDGPAIVFDRRSAYVIGRGWNGRIDAADAIVLHAAQSVGSAAMGSALEAVRGELFANRFMSIAQEMGQMLQRTTLSTNVKERLDFSCAILDAAGELLANAPHMPVHLGSMGMCVRAARQAIDMDPGDVIITNHPAFGGSHLPDITVITPVFVDGDLVGYVANRAHHAEIGGTRPGSMPPDATRLSEEGVIITPMKLIDAGIDRIGEIERLLRAGDHPSRAVDDNLADITAQLAANVRGSAALQTLVRQHGRAVVEHEMNRLKDRAESAARSVLAAFQPGRYEAIEELDDGTKLAVSIEIEGGQAQFEFGGSGGVHPGNLNATPAIVHSSVMYVLRLLMGRGLPLNEAILRAVQIRIPRGILNPEFPDDPANCPAVVGGNVETSQRLVDLLLKALRVAGCSQGTMNNTLFGNQRFGYYETVCGGSGATAEADGADAVHTHMTNTRITDPEIIEHRYPVRVRRFAVRRGSGGAGMHRGGDGATREIEFLESMSLSMLSQHRTRAPYGMNGGAPGACGSQQIVWANGDQIELKSIDGCEVQAGDRFILHTPGGGGFGPAPGHSVR